MGIYPYTEIIQAQNEAWTQDPKSKTWVGIRVGHLTNWAAQEPQHYTILKNYFLYCLLLLL